MITVIVPVYNSEETIEETMYSIFTQTAIDNIQKIVVINDGSTDKSEEIIKNFIEKNKKRNVEIQYIYQMNKGAASARNRGLQEVTTEYVAFLDSDDKWLPNKIERQMEIINHHPQIRFLGTAYNEKPLRIGFKKIPHLYNGTIKDLCIKNFPVTPSILMEYSFVKEVGLFDENRRYAEDINYFQKIACLGNYYYLSEKLVEIDLHKKYFAEKGLSANLRAMHEGTLLNIKELYTRKEITFYFYVVTYIFYKLKYYKRVIFRYIDCKRKKK